jgi:hypothetical protein
MKERGVALPQSGSARKQDVDGEQQFNAGRAAVFRHGSFEETVVLGFIDRHDPNHSRSDAITFRVK